MIKRLLFLTFMLLVTWVAGQKLPTLDIKKADGKSFNTSKITNKGKPVVISFWATWCAPCKKELNAITSQYEKWQKETGVVIYTVSIDDAKNSAKVAPYAKNKGWKYEMLLDSDQVFKNAMKVVNVPHTFILNGKGEVVWQTNTYTEGSEEKLYEALKKVSKGEKP